MSSEPTKGQIADESNFGPGSWRRLLSLLRESETERKALAAQLAEVEQQ